MNQPHIKLKKIWLAGVAKQYSPRALGVAKQLVSESAGTR
jgi:hypothetical protein